MAVPFTLSRNFGRVHARFCDVNGVIKVWIYEPNVTCSFVDKPSVSINFNIVLVQKRLVPYRVCTGWFYTVITWSYTPLVLPLTNNKCTLELMRSFVTQTVSLRSRCSIHSYSFLLIASAAGGRFCDDYQRYPRFKVAAGLSMAGSIVPSEPGVGLDTDLYPVKLMLTLLRDPNERRQQHFCHGLASLALPGFSTTNGDEADHAVGLFFLNRRGKPVHRRTCTQAENGSACDSSQGICARQHVWLSKLP